jgi:hypothetical protein
VSLLPSVLDGEGVASEPLHRILLRVILGDSQRLEFLWEDVTPDFPKKTKCISYVRQDQVYTHMMDVMSEISINNNKKTYKS